jgi:hypothetical protein
MPAISASLSVMYPISAASTIRHAAMTEITNIGNQPLRAPVAIANRDEELGVAIE